MNINKSHVIQSLVIRKIQYSLNVELIRGCVNLSKVVDCNWPQLISLFLGR